MIPWWMSLRFGFIALDDGQYVVQNPPVISGLTPQNIAWAFTTGNGNFWLPLTWLSLMLDSTVFGCRPFAFHFTNVLLHIANTLLVFYFLKTATRAPGRSLLVALLFAMHPLRVESVAWVTERKDVLFTFFGMWALLAYTRYARTGSWWFYGLMLMAYACSLMSKPTLVTMPAVLLLVDVWPLARKARVARLLLEKVPLVTLALVITIITIIIQQRTNSLVAEAALPLSSRLENMILSYALYLRDCFYFADLSIFYPLPQQIPDVQLGISLAVLLAVSALAGLGLRWRAGRPFLVGWLWFLITLFPTIGLVQSGIQGRADRFTYFPSIGLAAGLVFSWPTRWLSGEWAHRAALAGASLVLALTVYCTLQLRTWRDPLVLYQDGIAKAGDSEMLEFAQGWELQREGNPDRALEFYAKAIQLNPKLGEPHYNAGTILMNQGRTIDAIEEFKAAERAMPRDKQVETSLKEAQEALAGHPSSAP